MANDGSTGGTGGDRPRPPFRVEKDTLEFIGAITVYIGGLIALVLASFSIVLVEITPPNLLIIAVICGGVGGGLTLALIGGEKLGLKLPGQESGTKVFEPGFIGEIFVGVMAAAVMFGVGSVSDLRPFEYKPKEDDFYSLWFRNFALAHLSGFLGIQLIKKLASGFLDQADVRDLKEDAQRHEGQTAYLSGIEAIKSTQLDAAEAFMRKALEIEGQTSIRALVGLAMVLKRRGKLGDAIATINEAIAHAGTEPMKSRVAKAYFNRACYVSFGALGETLTEAELDRVIADLDHALAIEKALAREIKKDPDFEKALKSERFVKYVERALLDG